MKKHLLLLLTAVVLGVCLPREAQAQVSFGFSFGFPVYSSGWCGPGWWGGPAWYPGRFYGGFYSRPWWHRRYYRPFHYRRPFYGYYRPNYRRWR
jgi:hypothetical protein